MTASLLSGAEFDGSGASALVEEPAEIGVETSTGKVIVEGPRANPDCRQLRPGGGVPNLNLMGAARNPYKLDSQPVAPAIQLNGVPSSHSPETLYGRIPSPSKVLSSFAHNMSSRSNRRACSLLPAGELRDPEGYEMGVQTTWHRGLPGRSMSDGPLSTRRFQNGCSMIGSNKPSTRGDLGNPDNFNFKSHGSPTISISPTPPETQLFNSNPLSTSSSLSSSSAAPNPFFEKFKIRIMKVNHNLELNQPYVKVTFGDKVFVTPKSQSASGDWGTEFEFLVSYHYQLFGTCQLDLYASNWLLPDVHQGRAEIRLASLEGFPRRFNSYYELYEKKSSTGTISELARRTKHAQNLGAIQVQIGYRFMQPSDWEMVGEEPPTSGAVPVIGEQLVKIDDQVGCPKKRHSLLSNDPNYLDHEDDTMFDFVGSYILSKDTRAVLRGVARVYLAFFQGMELRHVEFFSGVLLLEKFYRHQACQEKRVADLALTNFDVAREACRLHRFAMAVYGWRGLMVFGCGRSVGPGQVFSDPRAVLAYLDMEEAHLLGYEFHTSQVFQPTYFIALDGDALVLSIRGTLSVMDTLADLVCDYLPWRGGLVHSGILTVAQTLLRNVIPGLMSHAVQRQVHRIYIVGHSLGAAAASLLTMMLLDHLHEFRLPGRIMDVRCFAYGPPPSVSANLAKAPRYRNHIHSIINGHDLVPRLSYGSMMDFKHMVLAATEAANDSVGSFLSVERLASAFQTNAAAAEAQFKALEMAHHHQNEVQHRNPKLYLPGRVHHIKTSHQLPEPFSYAKTAAQYQAAGPPRPEAPSLAAEKTSPPLAKESLKPPYSYMGLEGADEFLDFRVHASMLLDHLPSYYNSALESCLELIERFQPHKRVLP
ncbi:hypothetical protein L0F63_003331 [Massospora cicadina]|nr:hypothetical protein L0F63_003331 [Massospora cicadina]